MIHHEDHEGGDHADAGCDAQHAHDHALGYRTDVDDDADCVYDCRDTGRDEADGCAYHVEVRDDVRGGCDDDHAYGYRDCVRGHLPEARDDDLDDDLDCDHQDCVRDDRSEVRAGDGDDDQDRKVILSHVQSKMHTLTQMLNNDSDA